MLNHNKQIRPLLEEMNCGSVVVPDVVSVRVKLKRQIMKKLQIAICAASLAVALNASATTTVYSDTDFSSMASYNGTYVPGSPGYEALSYTSAGDDAMVGVRGPLGTLDNLSMSFSYDNLTSSGNDVPFAAFGISDNGLWDGSGNEFLIISLDGNQLNGATQVHVWDEQTDAEYSPTLWGLTLNDILGDNGFGNMTVMRAYAYIGDEGASSGSVDINSITVSSAPVPEPTTIISGALLLLPFGAGVARKLYKKHTA